MEKAEVFSHISFLKITKTFYKEVQNKLLRKLNTRSLLTYFFTDRNNHKTDSEMLYTESFPQDTDGDRALWFVTNFHKIK